MKMLLENIRWDIRDEVVNAEWKRDGEDRNLRRHPKKQEHQNLVEKEYFQFSTEGCNK
jgi:hypothetical protein